MITEVKDLAHFDKCASIWNNKKNINFWKFQSCLADNFFDPESIEFNLRNMLIDSLSKDQPTLKIWSYEEEGVSLGGGVYIVRENFMMGENILEEILWQIPGKFAESYKEKKILIKILKRAEDFAKSSNLDAIIVSRNIHLHKFSKDKDDKINNFYTKNNYSPYFIQYRKNLKINS